MNTEKEAARKELLALAEDLLSESSTTERASWDSQQLLELIEDFATILRGVCQRLVLIEHHTVELEEKIAELAKQAGMTRAH